MKIKNFTPSTDWYFEFKDANGKTVTWRLAGFAVVEGKDEESDSVVGMVPVTGGGQSTVMPGVCRLSTVPPVEGVYKHVSDLGGK